MVSTALQFLVNALWCLELINMRFFNYSCLSCYGYLPNVS